ncbi:MAG: DUF47 domain-containing protein [Bdellovibrionota bacterium]
MFGSLMPREGKFFDLFEQSAEQIVLGAHEFRKMIVDLGQAEMYARSIKAIEHRADEITHQTVELLHKTFITPLDREDIHSLISRMDDILDFIEAASQRIALYDIKSTPPQATDLADVVVKAALAVEKTVKKLRNLKQSKEIVQLCVEINKLENDADHILRAAMAKLFREEPDTRNLIKIKEIYELLETVTDRCEDVANIIEGIVLEYA